MDDGAHNLNLEIEMTLTLDDNGFYFTNFQHNFLLPHPQES